MPQLIINTYVSLMYELKKKICWDRALVLRKKNLQSRGFTKVEKHCSRHVFERYLIRISQSLLIKLPMVYRSFSHFVKAKAWIFP